MAKIETLQDDFTSATPDATKWPTTSSGYVSIVSGRLQIISPAGQALYNSCVSASTYDLTGSYVFCRVQPATISPFGTGSQETYLSLDKDSNNQVYVYWAASGLLFGTKTAGTTSETLIDVYPGITGYPWWRIRHNTSDGKLYAGWSSDGRTWSEFATGKTVSWAITAMAVDLIVGKWQASDPAGTGTFDGVNITPPANSTTFGTGRFGTGTFAVSEVFGADTGTGAESAGTVKVSSSDTGSGADAVGSRTVRDSDTGSGADSAGSVSIPSMSDADTATGTEDLGSTRTVASSDTGSGADTVAARTASGADVGATVEDGTTVLPPINDGDTATGTEVVTGRTVRASDTGSGTDVLVGGGSNVRFGTDSGSASEGATAFPPGTYSKVPNPKVWSNGDDLRAGTLNLEWRDTFNWLLRRTTPRYSGYNDSLFTYASGVAIPLENDVLVRGNLVHDFFDTKVYVYEPGWYVGVVQIGADLNAVTAGGTLLYSILKVNGVTSSIFENSRNAGTISMWSFGHQFSVYLHAGDYVEIALGGAWSGQMVSPSAAYAYPRLDLSWRSR